MSTLVLYEDLHDAISPIWLGRFYATTVPKVPTYPCGVYTVLGGEPNLTLCGPSNLTRYRIRIEAFSREFREVIANRDAIVEAMMKFKHANEQVSEYEMYESEVGVYRRLLDFSVWFNEIAAGPATSASLPTARRINNGRL